MTLITRRNFLAKSAAVASVAGLTGLGTQCGHAGEPLVGCMPNADKLGWRMGFSAYSFRNATVFEALDKMAATGLHFTELFAWQKLSPAHLDAKPAPGLSKTLQKDLKKKAADSGVQLLGLYSNVNSPEAAKALFAFAAQMEFEFIVSEPTEAVLDAIEPLTDEYGIDLALHNHPKPSHYWNPETGLAALNGRSKGMGFCCDTGHWCRCGLDPVETLRKVAPRVKTFHLKDLDVFGVREAKDVVWGRGKGHIEEILAEVKTLGIEKPYFGIEWERDPNEPLATHADSAAFFEQIAGTLVPENA